MNSIKNTASQEPPIIMRFVKDNEGNITDTVIFDLVQRTAAILLVPIGSPILPMGA